MSTETELIKEKSNKFLEELNKFTKGDDFIDSIFILMKNKELKKLDTIGFGKETEENVEIIKTIIRSVNIDINKVNDKNEKQGKKDITLKKEMIENKIKEFTGIETKNKEEYLYKLFSGENKVNQKIKEMKEKIENYEPSKEENKTLNEKHKEAEDIVEDLMKIKVDSKTGNKEFIEQYLKYVKDTVKNPKNVLKMRKMKDVTRKILTQRDLKTNEKEILFTKMVKSNLFLEMLLEGRSSNASNVRKQVFEKVMKKDRFEDKMKMLINILKQGNSGEMGRKFSEKNKEFVKSIIKIGEPFFKKHPNLKLGMDVLVKEMDNIDIVRKENQTNEFQKKTRKPADGLFIGKDTKYDRMKKEIKNKYNEKKKEIVNKYPKTVTTTKYLGKGASVTYKGGKKLGEGTFKLGKGAYNIGEKVLGATMDGTTGITKGIMKIRKATVGKVEQIAENIGTDFSQQMKR